MTKYVFLLAPWIKSTRRLSYRGSNGPAARQEKRKVKGREREFEKSYFSLSWRIIWVNGTHGRMALGSRRIRGETKQRRKHETEGEIKMARRATSRMDSSVGERNNSNEMNRAFPTTLFFLRRENIYFIENVAKLFLLRHLFETNCI